MFSRHLCQQAIALGESGYFRAKDQHPLAGPILAQMAGGGRQGSGGSRCGDHILNFRRHHSGGDAVHFAGDESLQPFQLTLARRIVAQEFVGETDRAERHTDKVANVTAGRNGQLAASAADVHH